MDIDPKDKAAIDAIVDVEEAANERRGWAFWLAVAAVSVVFVCIARFDVVPGAVRIAFALVGGVGILLFLCFLSTKPFGRDFYNGPEWWL